MAPLWRAVVMGSFWLIASTVHAQDPFLRRTATVEVVERRGPAVVSITTEKILSPSNTLGSQRNHPQFNRYFSDLFESDRPNTGTQ